MVTVEYYLDLLSFLSLSSSLRYFGYTAAIAVDSNFGKIPLSFIIYSTQDSVLACFKISQSYPSIGKKYLPVCALSLYFLYSVIFKYLEKMILLQFPSFSMTVLSLSFGIQYCSFSDWESHSLSTFFSIFPSLFL